MITDMAILAVDPGKTTGCALWVRGSLMTTSEYQYPTQFLEFAEEITKRYGRDLVLVIEDFVITAGTAKKSPAPWSLKIIGALEWLAHKSDTRVVMQKVGDAKVFATNAKLRQLNLCPPGDHERDACRHLLLYLTRKGAM